MGNEQSNRRTTNYKVFRICRKEEHSDWFRCYLDDYVSYNDGDEKRIDFKDQSTLQVTQFVFGAVTSMPTSEIPFLHEGDYIRIDMNYTREYSSGYNFGAGSIKKVGYERVDSDGKISIIGVVAGVADNILQARQRYAEQAQYNRWLAQTESWTSYNLPPR